MKNLDTHTIHKITCIISIAIVLLISTGCTTYSSITRHDDTIYITGNTNFFIFGGSWVKKCYEAKIGNELQLFCTEIKVLDQAGEQPNSNISNIRLSTLTDEKLISILQANTSVFKNCVNKEEGDEKIGELIIQLEITGEEGITSANITSQKNFTLVIQKCLESNIKTIKIPRFAKDKIVKTVKYTFYADRIEVNVIGG